MFTAGTEAAEFAIALFASAAVYTASAGSALASGAADGFGAAFARAAAFATARSTGCACICWGPGLQSASSWNVPGRRNMFWIMAAVPAGASGAVWLTMAFNTPSRY